MVTSTRLTFFFFFKQNFSTATRFQRRYFKKYDHNVWSITDTGARVFWHDNQGQGWGQAVLGTVRCRGQRLNSSKVPFYTTSSCVSWVSSTCPPLGNTLSCMACLHLPSRISAGIGAQRHISPFCTNVTALPTAAQWSTEPGDTNGKPLTHGSHCCFLLEDGTSGVYLFDIHYFFWSPAALALPVISFPCSANQSDACVALEQSSHFFLCSKALCLLLKIIHVPTVLSSWDVKGEGWGMFNQNTSYTVYWPKSCSADALSLAMFELFPKQTIQTAHFILPNTKNKQNMQNIWSWCKIPYKEHWFLCCLNIFCPMFA